MIWSEKRKVRETIQATLKLSLVGPNYQHRAGNGKYQPEDSDYKVGDKKKTIMKSVSSTEFL